MKGFSSPEVLARVKAALSQAHKSVTYFNSRYYQDSFESYCTLLMDLTNAVDEGYHKDMLQDTYKIVKFLDAGSAAWAIKLAMESLLQVATQSVYRHPLHLCCMGGCADPYVLMNILRTDQKYRDLLPAAAEEAQWPDGSGHSVSIDVNMVTADHEKATPLHFACQLPTSSGTDRPELSLVQLLIKAGADLNALDGNGMTPLDYALKEGNTPVCAILMSQPELNVAPSEFSIPDSINFASMGMNTCPERLSLLGQHLENLDLSKNPIATLSDSFASFINLKRICLRDMTLRAFPACLFSMTKLQYIDLSNNLITHIPPRIECLVNLKTLKLRENKLNSLPSSLATLPLQKLALERNPLESIPTEVTSRGLTTLMGYLRQMEGQANTWKRIKLLVLGEEATGKTSLLKSLQVKNKTNRKSFLKRINHKPLSTDGLIVGQWKPDPAVEFQTWDFAGQQVYFSTHQFFLASRCIYIITFNAVNLNAARPAYWVRQIRAVARDRPPIFLVGTHADDPSCDETLRATVKHRMKTLMNFQNNNIVDCLFISSKEGQGIRELTEQLTQAALESNMLKQMVPSNYMLLDQLLAKEREKHQWVRWSMYLKWANQCGIAQENLSLTTRFLHDVGSLIYFENSADLRDIVILDPQWLADVFASLITFNHHWIKDGILHTRDLPQVWKHYPAQLYPKLLMLLTKFGVASRLGTEKTPTRYIIPSLLDESRPDNVNEFWEPLPPDNIVEFGRVYTFNFTFEFSKILVVLLHAQNLHTRAFWRNGIAVVDTKSPGVQQALLTWLPGSSQLKFSIRMNKSEFQRSQKIQLLRQIAEIVDSILEGFYCGSPSITREVLCTHCLQRKNSLIEGVYQFRLDQLVDLVSKGQWVVHCRGVPSRPVDIRILAPDIAFCDFPVIDPKKYEIIKEVGRGGFGVVYKARLAGRDAAVKELLMNVGESVDSLDESDAFQKFAEFQQEVYVMSALDHVNLVRLFGVSLNPLRMIMEWCGSGDLFHLLHPSGSEGASVVPSALSWKLRYKIALDIARGMTFLQGVTPPIVHRDLRSPNIFLVSADENAPICAKVADFGLSRHVENVLGETLPTWRWLAPEVINFESQSYDERSDIYSFAIVLWELATAGIPYDEYSESMSGQDLRRGIITGKLRPTIPDSVDPRFATLMRQCWRNDPTDRLPFSEAVRALSNILGQDPDAPTYLPSNKLEEKFLKEISMPQLKNTTVDESEDTAKATFVPPTLVTKKEKLRPKPITCMLAVGQRVWCGFDDGYITVFDSASQMPVSAFSAFDGTKIFRMVATENGTVWVSSAYLKIFDAKTFKKKRSLTSKDVVMAMALVHLHGKEYVWTGDFQGNLTVWNSGSAMPSPIHRIKIGEPIYSLAQNEEHVWIGLYRKLLVYQAQSASPYATGDTNQLKHLLNFNGEMWSALNDNLLHVWNLEAISVTDSLEGHTGRITALAAVNERLWTGGFDKTILIWDTKTHKCLYELSNHHGGAIEAIAQNANLVWIASEDCMLSVWRLAPSNS